MLPIEVNLGVLLDSLSLFTGLLLRRKLRKHLGEVTSLDPSLDALLHPVSLDTGRLVAHVLGAVAQFERERIADRTREALAEAKRQGKRLGRPRQLPAKTISRIVRSRERGETLRAIAERLNADDVATAHGGRQWYPRGASYAPSSPPV